MSADYRRLYRSRSERMIAGVAGGLAEYFNVDPTLVRLLFVILTLAGGPGLIAYIILWIIVPETPASRVSPAPPATTYEEPLEPNPPVDQDEDL